MTSVRIKFRKSAIRDKEGVLYFQIIHKRKAKLITTRFHLFSHEWDARSSTARIDNANSERGMYLQNMEESLNIETRQIYDLISMLEKRNDYTVKELAEYYIHHSFNGNFFPFIKYLIKKRRAENHTKTATLYETAQRSFARFRHGEDIRIDKLDHMLMQQYETYLRNNKLCINSISCYMRALRAIYNQAVQKGLTMSKNPFKDVYTGIDKTSKRAVREDIIMKLKGLNLSGHTSLQLTRDLFLFSFYTRGMSFIDMANLKQSNLKNGYIVYARSKTKQVLTVRIENCIEEILERYQHVTINDYALPVYNRKNQDYNSHLRTYNKRLKRISGMLDLEKPLSSYVARHSWATIALRKGISVQVISEGMGHENEKTTRIYLASLDQSVVDNANAQIIAL
jgi:site-specific recombinase XerD